MTEEELKKFKDRLLEEKAQLEGELKSIGRINPNNPADWEPVPGDMDKTEADSNETADGIEEYEGNTAILKQLETRYNLILHALKKFDTKTYGKCEISGKDIEVERLEANPAARTGINHIGEEEPLVA